ncbi:MAG TPA: phytoene/squalene synthase family protein [Vineibacter sp.]|nr:phytoene/squalene synthase family protein [Vineibacter sp.]
MPDFDPNTRVDLAACRAALRHGSRTFLAASFLLPRPVRDGACALYAFCRDADDAVDLGNAPADALADLMQRIELVYDGRPGPSSLDRALARVVLAYGIPKELLSALAEGFSWDAEGRHYESESDLLAYASRVAGTVGVMMAILMGQRAPAVLARAAELGMAMQLTNIARDVGEDARAGRLYLPLQWLRESGIEPNAWLAQPVSNPAIRSMVERILRLADGLYRRGDAGIAALPLACRPGVAAARALYAAIGREVERRGCDSVSARAFVPPMRKAWLLGQALIDAFGQPPPLAGRPLAETRYLVDAVVASPMRDAVPPIVAGRGGGWRALDERITWLVDLFVRLERRDLETMTMVRPKHTGSAEVIS